MDKLIVLKIDMPFGEAPDSIHPVVLRYERNCVLVDCGYVGSLPKIEAALRQHSLPPSAVTHIVITHQDHDHMGAAAAFKAKYPEARVLASDVEAPYISGLKKPLRLDQAERLQETLPENQQEFGRAFCRMLRSVEPVQIDQHLTPGELLPFCGGCRVLPTPGHTPGHISLYLPEFDTIITGDAIALENGNPALANPRFTLDTEKAAASMHLLLSHPARKLICYHGGLFEKEL